MNSQSNPSQQELQLWLNAVEYQFAERKSKKDKGGWLKTIVAFANSTPANTVSVLYIGANDDGSLEGMTDKEIEDTMKSLGAYIGAHSWPFINTIPIPLEKEGKKCLVMIVPYSAQRPHFAGRAYVRRGTETIDASEAQYEELIWSCRAFRDKQLRVKIQRMEN
jgi:predicted HTH transcriptional regulator